jgi:hypothetical protein
MRLLPCEQCRLGFANSLLDRVARKNPGPYVGRGFFVPFFAYAGEGLEEGLLFIPVPRYSTGLVSLAC